MIQQTKDRPATESQGEVIRVNGDHVLCWVDVAPGERVKTSLRLDWFDGVPEPGSCIRWSIADGKVFLDATEDNQIATEIKRLNRDWADGVKDMELHTADEDRPTHPEQIGSAATPIRYIEAGERLMEAIRHQQRQEAGACMAAVRATRESPRRSWRSWRGVLVAVLVGLLLGAVMVACCGCSEPSYPYQGPYPAPCRYEDMVIQSQSCRWCDEGPVYQLPAGNYWCDRCGCFQEDQGTG
jgi:hypothetical protein